MHLIEQGLVLKDNTLYEKAVVKRSTCISMHLIEQVTGEGQPNPLSRHGVDDQLQDMLGIAAIYTLQWQRRTERTAQENAQQLDGQQREMKSRMGTQTTIIQGSCSVCSNLCACAMGQVCILAVPVLSNEPLCRAASCAGLLGRSLHMQWNAILLCNAQSMQWRACSLAMASSPLMIDLE
jgi:hypothetical protein